MNGRQCYSFEGISWHQVHEKAEHVHTFGVVVDLETRVHRAESE